MVLPSMISPCATMSIARSKGSSTTSISSPSLGSPPPSPARWSRQYLATIESISHIPADGYFMDVTGIHAERELSTGDFEECHVKRAWMNAAAETIVLASQEKLNTASPYGIAAMTEIDGMVVPAGVPDETLAPFRVFTASEPEGVGCRYTSTPCWFRLRRVREPVRLGPFF